MGELSQLAYISNCVGDANVVVGVVLREASSAHAYRMALFRYDVMGESRHLKTSLVPRPVPPSTCTVVWHETT